MAQSSPTVDRRRLFLDAVLDDVLDAALHDVLSRQCLAGCYLICVDT